MTDDEDEHWFVNYYKCPYCGTRWSDTWTATCNDECPQCEVSDIEPYRSEDA